MNAFRSNKKLQAVVGGTATYVIGVTLAYKYIAGSNDNYDDKIVCDSCCSCSSSFVKAPNRVNTFSRIAHKYDTDIDMDEFVLGIKLMRRFMLYWHAKGNCLEIGSGTGRNLKYYPINQIDKVVISDSSDEMLLEAKKKIQQMNPKERSKFIVSKQDVHDISTFPDESFDTVIDSFGLCSFDDPVTALKEMKRVCKKDGKILLLEHGRSKTFEGITKHLDANAETHAKNWGCVWNRDIDDLLEKSGIYVEVKRVWHFGTTYYCIARKGL